MKKIKTFIQFLNESLSDNFHFYTDFDGLSHEEDRVLQKAIIDAGFTFDRDEDDKIFFTSGIDDRSKEQELKDVLNKFGKKLHVKE